MTALDLSDSESKPESDAYRSLVSRHREAAARLAALGQQMAGYRDLPMANHDTAALSNDTATEVFAALIRHEGELVELLQQRLSSHREMLKMMTEGR
jgi:hypothetical protein